MRCFHYVFSLLFLWFWCCCYSVCGNAGLNTSDLPAGAFPRLSGEVCWVACSDGGTGAIGVIFTAGAAASAGAEVSAEAAALAALAALAEAVSEAGEPAAAGKPKPEH